MEHPSEDFDGRGNGKVNEGMIICLISSTGKN